MKINKLCILLLSIGIMSSCSKLDETTRISKDMRDRSERMEAVSNQTIQNSKAQAMLEDMRASLNHIKDTETLEALSAEASIFFGYMPFQKIKLNAADREKYIKGSLVLFFLSPYNEYLPENENVNPSCDVNLERVCDEEKRNRFMAFALASDVIADEQKEFEGKNAQSFIDILIDLIKIGKKVESGDIDYLSLSDHQKESLLFEEQAINFLQYVHNVTSIAAINQVINLEKLKLEMSTITIDPSLNPEDAQIMLQKLKVQKILASVKLPKTALMYKAMKDIQTSRKIISALSEVNVSVVHSEQVKNAYATLPVIKLKLAASADKKADAMSVVEKNFLNLTNVLEKFSVLIK